MKGSCGSMNFDDVVGRCVVDSREETKIPLKTVAYKYTLTYIGNQ
jgi:hypothetical protein